MDIVLFAAINTYEILSVRFDYTHANNKHISCLSLFNKHAGWKKLLDQEVLRSPMITQHRSICLWLFLYICMAFARMTDYYLQSITEGKAIILFSSVFGKSMGNRGICFTRIQMGEMIFRHLGFIVTTHIIRFLHQSREIFSNSRIFKHRISTSMDRSHQSICLFLGFL